ncbi:hypothetical protein [Chryseobacterium turcicum]|uniref:Uncharacterized protein n=1 Tax=Chryseobacterium turcicum TaxID=2898076 RepID=A0A9Q3V2T4_9FLAO|nr:hypothetical protein [Chryseobacterium turcicum]MCD1116911.1 hypothetical protein [Chryseobacterium turcicum]
METKFTYLVTKDKVEMINDLDFAIHLDYLVIEEFKDMTGFKMEEATESLKKFNTLDEIFESKLTQSLHTQKIISIIQKLKVENFFLHHCTDNENFGLPLWSSLLIVKNKEVYKSSDLYDVQEILDYNYFEDIL